jgi:hypothetical protein
VQRLEGYDLKRANGGLGRGFGEERGPCRRSWDMITTGSQVVAFDSAIEYSQSKVECIVFAQLKGSVLWRASVGAIYYHHVTVTVTHHLYPQPSANERDLKNTKRDASTV